ncbi:MAG: hypothetical protein MZV70_54290 [Desulfobacterales bacterium]|nr:hypothetical protein [Desulfobacterales bacterium]
MGIEYLYNLPTPKRKMTLAEQTKYLNDMYDALTQWTFDLAGQLGAATAASGATGATGPAGATGPTGPQGPTGASAPSGSYATAGHDIEDHGNVFLINKIHHDILSWNATAGQWYNPVGQAAATIQELTYLNRQAPIAGTGQGVCSDGTYLYSTSTTSLHKYRISDWHYMGGLTLSTYDGGTLDHAGDPCVYGGIVYIPMSDYPTSPGTGKVLTVNASTMAIIGWADADFDSNWSAVARHPDGTWWLTTYSVPGPVPYLSVRRGLERHGLLQPVQGRCHTIMGLRRADVERVLLSVRQ